MPSAAMLLHLASNVTFLAELWRMTAPDGTVAAYAAHTRDLTYDSVLYKAAPVEPTRPTRKIGVEPDGAELFGVFDSIVTEAGLVGGKWKKARIQKDIVNYTDLTMGSALIQKGFAGEFSIRNGTFRVEYRSLSSLLQQRIGDLTSPLDRRRTLAETGISLAAHTHATTVQSFTDRRKFKVSYVQPSSDYFKYGLATFTSGANNGLKMEIKSSTTADGGTRTEIELQLPMPSAIAVTDGVSLVRGYDGTRAGAKLIDTALVTSMEAEPDLPGLNSILTYPE